MDMPGQRIEAAEHTVPRQDHGNPSGQRRADQTQAARKKGLKAILQTANGLLLAACTAGIALLYLSL